MLNWRARAACWHASMLPAVVPSRSWPLQGALLPAAVLGAEMCCGGRRGRRCQMAGRTCNWAAGGKLAAFPWARLWLPCCHPLQFGQETCSASAAVGSWCRKSSLSLFPKGGNFSGSRARKAEQSHLKVKRQKMNLRYRELRILNHFFESGGPGLCPPSTWIQCMWLSRSGDASTSLRCFLAPRNAVWWLGCLLPVGYACDWKHVLCWFFPFDLWDSQESPQR